MAVAKRPCPACGKKVVAGTAECPHCGREVERVCWELETGGERRFFAGKKGLAELGAALVSGSVQLGDRCRQRIEWLDSKEGRTTSGGGSADESERQNVDQAEGENGGANQRFVVKEERAWQTLGAYADSEFELRRLYDPVGAWGKRSAFVTWGVVGVVVAVAWNTDGLLAYGAHPIVALLLGAGMLLLLPTVIGLIVGSLVVGSLYGVPGMGMGFRTLVAAFLGVAVGAVVGWTFGYLVGAVIGMREPRRVVPGHAARPSACNDDSGG